MTIGAYDEPSPPIAAGDGAVAIALIKTRVVSELVRMTFDDGAELTGTHDHHVWSLHRGDWVALGNLMNGVHRIVPNR
ncbi:MAG: hypothetical protein SGI77_07350 [Pirellulaceae bacterium]|nr:hypothetical protein [Pirellulaceae bacterium]